MSSGFTTWKTKTGDFSKEKPRAGNCCGIVDATRTVTHSRWVATSTMFRSRRRMAMNRRELVGVLGATAAGLAAITGGGASAQEARAQKHDRHAFHPERGHHTEVQQECAEACARCMHECEDGFHHCLLQAQSEKAEYALAAQMCIDCAEVCGAAAKLVARGSPLLVDICPACAKVCDDCFATCEPLNDPEMKLVMESLRKCAMSCRGMVKAMGDHEHHHPTP